MNRMKAYCNVVLCINRGDAERQVDEFRSHGPVDFAEMRSFIRHLCDRLSQPQNAS
jgi:hypothetical protein